MIVEEEEHEISTIDKWDAAHSFGGDEGDGHGRRRLRPRPSAATDSVWMVGWGGL